MTPDAGAAPGEPGPADGSGSRKVLTYRSAQGRWVVAAMVLGSSVAGIDSTVVAVALPAIGRVAGLLWIAALPPITGLTGTAYADPARFRSSFGQISWICAAAFAVAAALAATLITGPRHPAQEPRPALIQTPVPHLACPVAYRRAPGRVLLSTRTPRAAGRGRDGRPRR